MLLVDKKKKYENILKILNSFEYDFLYKDVYRQQDLIFTKNIQKKLKGLVPKVIFFKYVEFKPQKISKLKSKPLIE